MPSPHRRPPGDLSPSLEHYLRAIFTFQEEKGYARVTDIAQMLGVAKPAVTTALKTLRANGLVDHKVYESVLLTEEGMNRAKGVAGKFSILFQFLGEVLGVEEKRAFVDACLMEHYISGDTTDRLVDLIRFFEEERQREVREAFHAYRRSCESDNTCPACEFHCEFSVHEPGEPSGDKA